MRVLCTSGALLTSASLLLAARHAAGQSQHQPPPSTQPAPLTTRPAVAPTPDEIAQLAARNELISGLIGSPHDFSHGGRSGRDLCLPCHTPHLITAAPPLLDQRPEPPLPLRPYRAGDVELNGWSLLCLGCHDGVTASDVYTSGHALQVTGVAGLELGRQGLRSHPIGILYPENADGYHPLARVLADGLPLPDGRIQCTTCHDAHNTHGHEGMLKISNDRSGMCLACHRI
jgi:predicted CXXCH cytochrome family protein